MTDTPSEETAADNPTQGPADQPPEEQNAPEADAALDDAAEAVAEAAGTVESDPEGDSEAEEMLAAARAAIAEATDAAGSSAAAQDPQAGDAAPFQAPSFDAAPAAAGSAHGIDLLGDVELDVKIELGRTRMLVEDVLKLSDGAVVELDKLAGDPVDVFVNGRHVAKGEVLVLNDNFCVRINQVLDPEASEAQSA